MNILFLTPEIYYGGAGTILRELANGLVSRGHSVTIGSDQSLDEIADYQTYFDLDPSIDVIYPIFPRKYNLRFAPLNFINFHLKAHANVRRMKRACHPDVIITFMANINGRMTLYNMGSRIPIIASEHSAVSRPYSASIERYRRWGYPKAAAVTVLTTTDLKLWEHHKNVVLMPNPVLTRNDVTPRQRQKVVLAAGRITGWEIKGYDTLIRVWSRLESAHPDWKLVIAGIGDAPSYKVLKDMIGEHALKNIEFPGQIKDLSLYMRNVEIFVMTSRFEGFPTVLGEAMDAECCCVTFDCDNGPRDMIQHGVSGYLVENQNEDKMAETLDILMDDSGMRQSVARNARKDLARFDYNAILDRWEALIKAVVEKQSLSPFRK